MNDWSKMPNSNVSRLTNTARNGRPMKLDFPHVHTSYVRKAGVEGGWHALVRYWMAHQHKPALDAAIAVVRGEQASATKRWRQLVAFLSQVRDEPFNRDREVSEELVKTLPHEGQLTLLLLRLFPRMALCETAGQFPVEEQDGLFDTGLQAAKQAVQIAAALQDEALVAFCKVNLAGGLQELRQLEAARASFEEALATRRELARQRPDVYQPDVAMTLNNLGSVQDALNDLEAARASYQEALAIRRELARQRPDVYRPDVAMTLNNLGTVQRDLNDLEAARASVEEALAGYRELARQWPDVYRPLVAITLNNLGNVQSDLNDLEAARASHQEALAIRRKLARQRPDVYRPLVATTLNNLGNAQRALNDLEAAYASHHEALAIRRELARQRPDVYRPLVATTLNNLGSVQGALNDLVAARASHQEALAIRRELARQRPEVYQPDVGTTLNNLGNAQRNLNDLEAARASYQEALAIRRELARQRPDVYRPDVATTLNNLGSVQDALNDLEAARASHQEALAIRRELARQRPDVYRPLVATTLNNLGTVQGALNDLVAARASYQEAAQSFEADAVTRPSARLVERQRTWNNLGRLHLNDAPSLGWPDRHTARDAFRKARDCAEAFRQRFRDPDQRKRVQGEALHVYDNLVGVNVDIWQVYAESDALPEAVEVAEASRARNLIDMLTDEVLDPAGAPPDLRDDFRTLRRRLMQARRRLDDEENASGDTALLRDETQLTGSGLRQMRSPGGYNSPSPTPAAPRPASRLDEIRREFEELQRQHDAALSRLRADYDAEFNPDDPVAPITFAQARELLPTDMPTAFVQYSLTQQRGLALVVTHDDVFAITLPDLAGQQGWELAEAWYSSYYGGDRAAWEAAVPGLLRPVAERAVRPVVAALAGRGIRRLVLSPNRALHVFPLHACTLDDGRYLADAFDEVAYTPSLSLLHRCAGRQRPRPSRLVLVENPTADLPFTEVEGAGLRRLYADHCWLPREQADRDTVMREAASSHVLHYTGHAAFDIEDPLRSALVLGGKRESQRDDWLTLRHVFTQLHIRQNVLTVLNGCESGMVRPDRVDEYVGLASGFLFAGATCVLSTLWAVYDVSSALLAHRFHELYLEGRSVGAALAAAQHWLRGIRSGVVLRDEVLPKLLERLDTDEQRALCEMSAAHHVARSPKDPPFASPVYWAPFIATGLSYPLLMARPAPLGAKR
ncbi:MAG TPA: CHAT domain-containing tetratricopeptide repeat protein [Gemmataceae bacterium]|nr:CHAT domain-containing tetratricopeptide repeat protein [Gemmataceae bacterium]